MFAQLPLWANAAIYRTVFRMGYDSLAVIVVYLGGVSVLYTLR